jgi:hypothetical protein
MNTDHQKGGHMKRILGAIALGAALSLSIAASPGNTASPRCSGNHEIELSEQLTSTALDYKQLTGQLYNGSTTQSYDDVQIQVNYYDNGNQMVGTETMTVNRDIEPGEVENISLAFNAPDNASHATWAVVCAETDHSLREDVSTGAKKAYHKIKFWD